MYGQRTAVGRLDLPRMLGDTTLALDGVRVRSPTRNPKPETRNSKPDRRGSRRGRVPAWSPGAGTCGARGRTRHLARPYPRRTPHRRGRDGVRVGSRLETRNPKLETRNPPV